MNNLTDEDLECLIRWPKGTNGWNHEKNVLRQLLILCEEHGFGRIPQLANQVEEMWRDKNKTKKKYTKEQNEYFELMKSYRK